MYIHWSVIQLLIELNGGAEYVFYGATKVAQTLTSAMFL